MVGNYWKFLCTVGELEELIWKHAVGRRMSQEVREPTVCAAGKPMPYKEHRTDQKTRLVPGLATHSMWDPTTPFCKMKRVNEMVSTLHRGPMIYWSNWRRAVPVSKLLLKCRWFLMWLKWVVKFFCDSSHYLIDNCRAKLADNFSWARKGK